MRRTVLFLLCTYMLELNGHAQQSILWYKQPATVWTEALPLGNGRLGAMDFGGISSELLQLNESTLWSGGPVKTNVNPDAPKYLPLIREALFKDKNYDTAIALTKKMQGLYTESYMPLGDVLIQQHFDDTITTAYYRDLNLRDAVATTKFTIDGTEYTRQVFSSAPDQVIIIRLSCNKPAQLNLLVGTSSLLHYKNIIAGNNEFIMEGKAPAHVDPSYYNAHKEPVIYDDTSGCNGMRFQLRIKAITKDGDVNTNAAGIHINNASEVILFLSAATSFNGYDKCPDKDGKDENQVAKAYLDKAVKKSFDDLLKVHVDDVHQYFDRVSFSIKDTANNDNATLPSDVRLQQYSNGVYDPGIETLYFQFGRYLLISSSRPGGTPANLQGIWNKELRPPWSSNFTININTQMNYWPAEVTNLSEMHEPLFQLIQELSITGKITAQQFYNMKGWVAHHNTDIWALSNPVGDKGDGAPRWANWAQGGNWLCRDLWEHYVFTGDVKFLRDTAYPLMKGAATFCLDWLVEDTSGYLVVAPSVSPENVFSYAKDKVSDVSVATTMDMSIIWDLFTNLIKASSILNIDADFRKQLEEKKAKLFPMHIGHLGNLQEWSQDYDDVEVHHRHVSHLFGLYPGNEISPVTTPAFAAAAKRTLEIRGDDGTGWSKAWKINFWARLLDGNHAYLLLRQLLTATSETGYNYAHGGGTYPDFFDAHPPFQIDGNFGGIAGMAEMLLQSSLDEIYLLPALPDAWKEGVIKGLKARGNFEVSIAWKDHQLTNAEIKAFSGGTCTIRSTIPVKIENTDVQYIKTTNGYLLSFIAEKGKTYYVLADKKRVTIGDYGGDGDMDIFIGGRVLPGNYPQSPRSYILRNNKGKFTDVTKEVCPSLGQPGMITAAMFTDFNNDKKPDLIIRGEWMPVRFFKNENGKFVEVTTTTGLQNNNGIWRSLQAAGIDNDGDIDYIAGNMGLNNKYNATTDRPIMMYAKDIDGNGLHELIPAYYIKDDTGAYDLFPGIDRTQFAEEFPSIKKKYLLNADYAKINMKQLIDDIGTKDLTELKCETTASVWIENLGNGKFKMHQLPIEAQFAPVNAILAKDFDDDGKIDLLVGGNEYQTEISTGRYDASYGCFLKGNGKGSFKAVQQMKSGFIIDGDVKSIKQLQDKKPGTIVLATVNNDSLHCFKFNTLTATNK